MLQWRSCGKKILFYVGSFKWAWCRNVCSLLKSFYILTNLGYLGSSIQRHTLAHTHEQHLITHNVRCSQTVFSPPTTQKAAKKHRIHRAFDSSRVYFTEEAFVFFFLRGKLESRHAGRIGEASETLYCYNMDIKAASFLHGQTFWNI